MNSPQINLTSFRKTFNIPSDFIRSTCKILNIEIEKIDNEQYISLNNDLLNTENDTILLYAFLESKETGKIEKQNRKTLMTMLLLNVPMIQEAIVLSTLLY